MIFYFGIQKVYIYIYIYCGNEIECIPYRPTVLLAGIEVSLFRGKAVHKGGVRNDHSVNAQWRPSRPRT